MNREVFHTCIWPVLRYPSFVNVVTNKHKLADCILIRTLEIVGRYGFLNQKIETDMRFYTPLRFGIEYAEEYTSLSLATFHQ